MSSKIAQIIKEKVNLFLVQTQRMMSQNYYF